MNDIPPSFLFVLIPLIFAVLGGLTLFWSLAILPIYYNYLRGGRSPIDQYVLALLGPDLSRVAVLLSGVIGIIVGSLLTRLVTKKFDTVKREGDVVLSMRMYFGLLFWWQCALIPHFTISLIEMALLEYRTSWFLKDISFTVMSGYFVAFGVPILLKYLLLLRYANSIDSQVKLVEVRDGRGFIKPVRRTTLKLVPSGPNP